MSLLEREVGLTLLPVRIAKHLKESHQFMSSTLTVIRGHNQLVGFHQLWCMVMCSGSCVQEGGAPQYCTPGVAGVLSTL